MDTNALLSFALPAVAILVMLFVLLRPNRKARTLTCTRCDGSGQVNEHWPDPSQPDGWHNVNGICPKCGGVGKV